MRDVGSIPARVTTARKEHAMGNWWGKPKPTKGGSIENPPKPPPKPKPKPKDG